MDREGGKNPQNQALTAPVSVSDHKLSVDAYRQVIRALRAQSNELSWEVEGTITELRRHLMVSNEEHREVLSMIMFSDKLGQTKNLREGAGAEYVATQAENNALGAPSSSSSLRPHLMTNADVMEDSFGVGLQNVANQVASPTISAFVAASPSLRPHSVAVGVPTLELGPPPGFPPRTNIVEPAIAPPKKLVKYASLTDILDDSPNRSQNTAIGWKVWKKDSEDNNLYEALITGYDPIHGHQTSVYNIDRPNGTLESIHILKVAPKDKGHADHKQGQNDESSKRGRPRGRPPKKCSKNPKLIL